MQMLKKAALVAAITVSTTSAIADEAGWYLGFGAGRAETKDWVSKGEAEEILNAVGYELGLGGIGTISSSSDNEDTAWKLFVGYQLGANFAVEAAYLDLGTTSAKSQFTGDFYDLGMNYVGSGSLSTKVEGETEMLTLDGVAMLSPTQWLDLFGKAGLYYAESELTASVTLADSFDSVTGRDSVEDNNTGVHFGVGANFNITDNVVIRAEWERFADVEVEDAESDIDLISLSAIYKL